MDRRKKATLNRDKATRLNEAFGIGALQSRYSDDGHWYALLERFPAALFDSNGYLVFPNEAAYRGSPHLSIGKQISVSKPGISGVPGYVPFPSAVESLTVDLDVHTLTVGEGTRRLVGHLQRERNRSIVRAKKRAAKSLDCEVCGFSFSSVYGASGRDYCEVHHLLPLGNLDEAAETRLQDLAIVCANCHRIIHTHNPPYTLDEVRAMLSRESTQAGLAGPP
jgi:5-methylcytosine-specific restriction endonuclease McrA